jgi:hypothetical protein
MKLFRLSLRRRRRAQLPAWATENTTEATIVQHEAEALIAVSRSRTWAQANTAPSIRISWCGRLDRFFLRPIGPLGSVLRSSDYGSAASGLHIGRRQDRALAHKRR